ncbi:hypothetical protein I0C86_28040 [Plantactinospora sp. S1510]|uniref:Uncharacterized protein n=1 Tax=Plantactinospora alkalitolerans TaxID=2789879 RepID=A0ABS0H3T7_9ACTN|nr:hypothetical protein [Plantactinospora alkalitolerans]MBF9132777.1 hypothetical protein [Plantactinospora alkalitolerans]
MTENASPFFIRPYRFDDPDPDDTYFPRLDWRRRLQLDTDEQVLWQDQIEVAGYLLTSGGGVDELAWTLPRQAEVVVTDRRLTYVCADCHIGPAPGFRADPRHRRRTGPVGTRVVTGQIRWQWPSALRIVPSTTGTDGAPWRDGAEHLLVVCDAVRATGRPALALSGGPLGSAPDLRRLTTVIRRAVAGFRLANPAMVELAPPEWDALLARAGLALFAEALADPRRGIDLPGALPVEFAHRDDYYRRSLRRRNAPTPSRSVGAPGANSPTPGANSSMPGANSSMPGANSSMPGTNSSAPGANSPTPNRNQSPSTRNASAPSRLSAAQSRWSERQPGSAS